MGVGVGGGVRGLGSWVHTKKGFLDRMGTGERGDLGSFKGYRIDWEKL